MIKYFSVNVKNEIDIITYNYLQAYPSICSQLYKTTNDIYDTLSKNKLSQFYGGEHILEDKNTLLLIKDMLNLTIVVEDMMIRDEPSYPIRKKIDDERDRIWSIISLS